MKLLTVTYKRCYHVNGRYFTTGGSPKEFNTLAGALDFHLLAEILDRDQINPQWEEIDPAVKCYTIGAINQLATFPPPLAAMKRARKIAAEIVEKENIDIVLMKGPNEVSMAPLSSLREFNIPLVYHYSLDWIKDVIVSSKESMLRRILFPYFLFAKFYRQAIGAYFFKKADALATVATPYARYLEKYKPGNVHLLPSTFTTTSNQIVTSPKSKTVADRFLFVGRIDRNKNLQLIACALAILNTKRPECSIEIDIIGEGDEYTNVIAYAKNLGVDQKFNYIGYVTNDNLHKYYQAAFALILPSFSELLPKVVIESFTMATPVIASKVGGIPDMITDGANGYFIDPHDAGSLADAMERLIDNPDYNDMQLAATKTAHQFSREATLEKWLTTFKKLISKRE